MENETKRRYLYLPHLKHHLARKHNTHERKKENGKNTEFIIRFYDIYIYI